tara:strand:+ start:3026 stop:4189 length:1164 start_codon:yes stop_codon:yes gene_type:complete
MSKLDLVILCGGRGTRLGKITKNIPKPLLKINDESFLEILIKFYQKYNLNKIFLLAGYKSELIKKKFHRKLFNLIPCEVIVEKKPMGTGGSLYLLRNKIKKNFILINGDSFINYNRDKFFNFNTKKKSHKILITKNINYKSNSKLANLEIKNKKIFLKEYSGKMNAGVYKFNKDIFRFIKNRFQSLEEEVIPKIIIEKKLYGEFSSEEFIDIGIKKNLNYAKKNFFKKKKSAVFLDRDGVINKNYGYVHKYSNFDWNRGIFKLLRNLTKRFDYIILVTNQSGIGRGYYDEEDFIKLHKQIKNFLANKKIYIDDLYFCPHHPEYGKGKYKKSCKCRKPGNLLIENAILKWNIDRNKALMIGDKILDKECAKKSKIKFQYYSYNLFKKF